MTADPLDPFVNKLRELIQLISTHSNESLTGPVPPDIKEKMKQLEVMVAAFHNIAMAQKELQGVTKEDLKKKIAVEKEKMPLKDKQFLEKTLALGKEVKGLKLGLVIADEVKKGKKERPFGKSKTTKEAQKERKQKFKKMKGDDKWKKL